MSIEEEVVELNNRILVRVGDVELDLTGTAKEIDARMAKEMQNEIWSSALANIRNAREAASEAAREAARNSGLPERGSAFKTLCDNNNLNRKPDQVLAAIQYLREVEGVHDSPPRVIQQLFDNAGIEHPGNLSLYLNRLRERGFLTYPAGDGNKKNRVAIVTTEGRTHLDSRSKR